MKIKKTASGYMLNVSPDEGTGITGGGCGNVVCFHLIAYI